MLVLRGTPCVRVFTCVHPSTLTGAPIRIRLRVRVYTCVHACARVLQRRIGDNVEPVCSNGRSTGCFRGRNSKFFHHLAGTNCSANQASAGKYPSGNSVLPGSSRASYSRVLPKSLSFHGTLQLSRTSYALSRKVPSQTEFDCNSVEKRFLPCTPDKARILRVLDWYPATFISRTRGM